MKQRPRIELLLPPGVVAFETAAIRDEAAHPSEELALGPRTVMTRRREFATGRSCARGALGKLGLAPVAIPRGSRGEPVWPVDVVGSITHCPRYTAAAAAYSADYRSVGIDAEEAAPLSQRLQRRIVATEEEATWARRHEVGGRIIFSAKEAVYKAWHPLARRRLGFQQVFLTFLTDTRFQARVPGLDVGGARVETLDGRWLVAGGLILTSVCLPR